MATLLSVAVRFRHNRGVLRVPPYLSFLCILIGVLWLLLLPLDNYSRRTYISENALLPGQVHTYFGGSDQNVFRAYKHEVNALAETDNLAVNDKLESIFKGIGLKVGRQNFLYKSAGATYAGENIYAILQAPRGDATEAIVLLAPWKNIKEEFNRNGVALTLTLSRYFRRWSLWSKDIIFVVTPDSLAGPQAWVDAYHDAHDSKQVDSLPLKSGALQGAIAIDYPQDNRFDSVHIVYDGVNGQLPNLDLINSVVSIAGGQMGMGVAIQEMWRHNDKYQDRLATMLRGMLKQGLGLASGPHSSFIPYHVDAVTLQPFGEGWQDEMAMGRVVEGTFRSLNNLLEHLHQSFFFYLLMHKDRFVSIGTYLPSAMLIAANFTIISIALWVKSGQRREDAELSPPMPPADTSQKLLPATERHVFLPLGLVAACQFLGVVPLYLFNHLPVSMLAPAFAVFSVLNLALPHILSHTLTSCYKPTLQQYDLIQSFSLLLLGLFLSALATLNFSLSFLVGLLATPLSFVKPSPDSPAKRWVAAALVSIVSPATILALSSGLCGVGLRDVLSEAAFGWDVWGMYTPVVVWCVWWPAWLVGMIVILGTPAQKAKTA
ncbi:Glycosylphosphatidylinositol transamidase [Pleurostoma richardsiae]|uniref:Glycosylphosphatidylinositol transamidase n=1 Tax=Pleurostoma richardsiae TaxID=41990 RepID=A0AA38RNW6_9PEZI|nr:Glycosylphosphatidylinositol transamidase [Pleurostoma richardsiae]